MRPLCVLLVQTDAGDDIRLQGLPEAAQIVRERSDRPEVLRGRLQSTSPHAVVLVSSDPVTLAFILEHCPAVPVVAVCDTEEAGITMLEAGAVDYVVQDRPARLPLAVQRAVGESANRRSLHATREALARSEEQYRDLVETANDVVLSIDLQGNFTALNTAGEIISGYTREELRQMNMAQLLAPESLQLALQMIQQKLIDNKPTMYELTMVARDGHHVPLEVASRLILHDGKPVGVQAIARDITERKRAEQALRESEARYRALFENASDIVYTHDLKGRFTAVNNAIERVIGYGRAELIGEDLARVVAPYHLDLAREMILQKLSEGITTTYEIDVITKDGRYVPLEINSQLIYQGGIPIGVQGIARDVTERRRAEEEVRARERKQAAVAELGQRALASATLSQVYDDAVVSLTRTLRVEYCTVTELLPHGRSLIVRAGAGWRPGLVGLATVGTGPESQAGYTLLSSEPVIVEDVEKETRFSVLDVIHEHKIRSGMSVIIHGHSRPFGVLSIFSEARRHFTQDDVHFLQAVANVLAAAIERTRMEEERARHSKELATRVLHAQEEERRRIARELHDETAQSLSMLLTNLDLLEPHIPADNRPLQTGFARVEALARRTLDETRALSHDLRPTILDDAGLVAALEWVAAEATSTFGQEVRVRTQIEPDRRLSSEMEVALFRIAQEAVINSGKHSAAAHVDVTVSIGGGVASLTVRDDGRGFDPRSVPGPTRAGRLGLYGMRERANILGGRLEIASAQGAGTTVTAQIPIPVDDAQPDGPTGITSDELPSEPIPVQSLDTGIPSPTMAPEESAPAIAVEAGGAGS